MQVLGGLPSSQELWFRVLSGRTGGGVEVQIDKTVGVVYMGLCGLGVQEGLSASDSNFKIGTDMI